MARQYVTSIQQRLSNPRSQLFRLGHVPYHSLRRFALMRSPLGKPRMACGRTSDLWRWNIGIGQEIAAWSWSIVLSLLLRSSAGLRVQSAGGSKVCRLRLP
ncbi:hypothetical protein BJX68DRAFT_233005 [Aspergillus pseudodeflectus]|uniref:Uncharacterized protein n=1 Tax=Aspergillus pseudodeflectus TaxID=176178 RepID=A0ABR4KPI3_9EURO